MMSNILENEDLIKAMQKSANDYFVQFVSQRKDYEEVWKIADYMAKCAQNRTVNSTEKSKGANIQHSNSEMANTGSTLFYRQISQLASQGMAVQMSSDEPFKYTPVKNEGVFYSAEDGANQAHQLNTLAKWTMKEDCFIKKSIDFWFQLKKYGNVPIMVFQKREKGKRNIRTPKYKIDPVSGAVIVEGVKDNRGNFITSNHPSLGILNIDSFYADANISGIQEQDCIFVLSLWSKADLWKAANDGEIDKEQMRLVGEKQKWNGTYGRPMIQDRAKNSGLPTNPSDVTEQYLVFDVMMKSPIMDDEWNPDEAEDWPIYWYRIVGNDPKEGIVVKASENFDPDGEFPIEMIHDRPGDTDSLYHMSNAEAIRSNYSVECTLKNLAIDNGALINRPPLLEVEGAITSGTDRVFKPGAHWMTSDINSIKEFQVRDTTQQTVALLGYVQEDTMRALGTDKPFMGEYAGSRTSATESNTVTQNAMTPHLIGIRYVLEQFLRFYARKLKSYWMEFALPEQIIGITDENMQMQIKPKEIFGEFDIQIDVVDEYENDMVQQQSLNEALRTVAEVEVFAKNTNIPELLRAYYKHKHMDYAKLVQPSDDADATQVANMENAQITEGIAAQVKPGENSSTHLAVHMGERIRYRGLEDKFPFIDLLDQHIEETKLAIRNTGAGGQAPLRAASGNETQGEITGNAMAAQLGAQMGG